MSWGDVDDEMYTGRMSGGLALDHGVTAAALMSKAFPPIKYVVPGYLVEGLTVFAGAPKLGKSWAVLDWSMAVASGGRAFDSIQCEQGDVLYLALEDNERRLQSRLIHMKLDSCSDRLTFNTQWPTLDDGCIREMENWIAAAESPRLIVVDTFAKIRGLNTGKETQYEADYRFAGELQQLALKRNLAVAIVHHTRKMEADDPFDAVSGTRGLTGAADTILVLKRDAGSQQPVLYGRGRDLEEVETALEFMRDNGRWRILGDAGLIAKTQERQEILEVLGRSVDPMTPTEIANTLGKGRSNVQQMVGKLFAEGKLEKLPKGRYALIHPYNSTNSYNCES